VCDGLILEFNHDPVMLATGPYPPSLQQRVGGPHGHLNNRQSVDLLSQVQLERLQILVAAHLSEKNNSPQRVRQTLLEAHRQLGDRLSLASQAHTTGWYQVEKP
jgi:phosphoribosyl 1,2-cyclic phosphodiesterase